MPNLPDLLSPLVGVQISETLALLLVLHVLAGLTCVATGLVAIVSPKRPGRHPRFGGIYFWSLSIVSRRPPAWQSCAGSTMPTSSSLDHSPSEWRRSATRPGRSAGVAG